MRIQQVGWSRIWILRSVFILLRRQLYLVGLCFRLRSPWRASSLSSWHPCGVTMYGVTYMVTILVYIWLALGDGAGVDFSMLLTTALQAIIISYFDGVHF